MALDPKKLRAFAPLVPDEEYRRKQQRLRRMIIGYVLGAIGLTVVFEASSVSVQFGVGVQFGDRLRGLIGLMSVLCVAGACFTEYFRFSLWYDRWIARRAHAYADRLEGEGGAS